MRTLKALSRQLLGARYQQIIQSLFSCAILFFCPLCHRNQNSNCSFYSVPYSNALYGGSDVAGTWLKPKYRKHDGKRESVFVYLLRYLLSNKNYLVNTVGLSVIACFLPFLLGQFEGLNAMPLGFAILCLNTPICILLSCDPDLEQAIRTLPRQAMRFCSRYCVFISCVNVTVSSFYLCSWMLRYGGIIGLDILTAILFAVQCAILSVLLEWLRPIRNWKIESDLWHHPRKYIVPLLMMFLAFAVSAWTSAVWIWLCILLAECVGLLLNTRRI